MKSYRVKKNVRKMKQKKRYRQRYNCQREIEIKEIEKCKINDERGIRQKEIRAPYSQNSIVKRNWGVSCL